MLMQSGLYLINFNFSTLPSAEHACAKLAVALAVDPVGVTALAVQLHPVLDALVVPAANPFPGVVSSVWYSEADGFTHTALAFSIPPLQAHIGVTVAPLHLLAELDTQHFLLFLRCGAEYGPVGYPHTIRLARYCALVSGPPRAALSVVGVVFWVGVDGSAVALDVLLLGVGETDVLGEVVPVGAAMGDVRLDKGTVYVLEK